MMGFTLGGTGRMRRMAMAIVLILAVEQAQARVRSETRAAVGMTLVATAAANRLGAFCLDGSLPAYHLDRGFGAGARNWLLQFEGGGWCNDVGSCLERSRTRRGSTRYMDRWAVFSGIMSKNPALNPDFHNWNRVRLRYCDGASFSGDSKFDDGVKYLSLFFFLDQTRHGHIFRAGETVFGMPSVILDNHCITSVLYFRGQKIWEAVILDLLPKGLASADKALLTGCSAGGLATFLHCDSFRSFLPRNASVKCMSDAGFFLDAINIQSNRTMRSFFDQVVSLQGVEKNLNLICRNAFSSHPSLCFFPQNVLRFTITPFFVLNSAYDVYQFHHALVPPSADPRGHWNRCKLHPTACNPSQLQALQGFRRDMLEALYDFFRHSRTGGMFINSCFAHCQSSSQDTWLAPDSPTVHGKRIAEAVGDWYFSRNVTKEIDCPYPCDRTCHNLIQ